MAADLGELDRLELGAGEHVRQERVEQRNVIGDELGDDVLAHGADQDALLVALDVGRLRLGERRLEEVALQVARAHQHGLERAEAKVVVRLRRELLLAQLEQRHDLAGEALGRLEALRVEHHLRDQFAIGLDHRDWAEELLEIVGQVRAAGVARVHRHEDAGVRVQPHLLAEDLHLLRGLLERDL